MTLGILDELRSLGLGSMLLQETYHSLVQKYPDCNLIYLHVVDYNTAAIKFYADKNGFELLKVEKNHYEIHKKEYDALTYYKFLDHEEIYEK